MYALLLLDLIYQQWFFAPNTDPVETNPKIVAKIYRNFMKELTALPDNNSAKYESAHSDDSQPRNLKPEAIIEELLSKVINFSYFPPHHQKEVLWDLAKIPLQNLTIRGSSVLATKNLEDLLESRTLHQITVIDCSGVVESDLEAIHAKCNTFDRNKTMNIIFKNCEKLSARVGELRHKTLKIYVVNTETLDQSNPSELLTLMKKVYVLRPSPL